MRLTVVIDWGDRVSVQEAGPAMADSVAEVGLEHSARKVAWLLDGGALVGPPDAADARMWLHSGRLARPEQAAGRPC